MVGFARPLRAPRSAQGAAGGRAPKARRSGPCREQKSGLVEDAFESLVAAGRTPEEANLARLAENRGEAGGGSQRIGGLEAGDGACRGDELGGQPGPHAGQAADEGRLRVTRQQGLQGAVELGGALTRGQGLLGQLPNQGSAGPLAGDRDALLPGGGERLVREDLDAGQAADR
jgi:hypothetical protein